MRICERRLGLAPEGGRATPSKSREPGGGWSLAKAERTAAATTGAANRQAADRGSRSGEARTPRRRVGRVGGSRPPGRGLGGSRGTRAPDAVNRLALPADPLEQQLGHRARQRELPR